MSAHLVHTSLSLVRGSLYKLSTTGDPGSRRVVYHSKPPDDELKSLLTVLLHTIPMSTCWARHTSALLGGSSLGVRRRRLQSWWASTYDKIGRVDGDINPFKTRQFKLHDLITDSDYQEGY